mgnify:CR=1 FL=1
MNTIVYNLQVSQSNIANMFYIDTSILLYHISALFTDEFVIFTGSLNVFIVGNRLKY